MAAPGTGPITLTRPQFAATAAAKKPGASYQGYLSFIAKRRAGPPAVSDPLAQTPQSQINQQINRVTGMYGTPTPNAGIQTAAQAELDPIIAAITKNIQGQAKTASGAISSNSQALAKALAGVDYGAPYRQATSDQAAVDAALQQSLNGGGSALAQDLQSRLGVIDDPTVSAAGSGLASRGTAIGTTELASGGTNLGALIAAAAAAKSYGQKMPGIAGLQGLEDIAGVNRQAVTDIGNQTTQVLNQLPQIVESLRNSNQTLRGNRASAAQQILETLTGQNITKATAAAGLGLDQAKLNASTAADAARIRVSEMNTALKAEGLQLQQSKQQAALNTAASKGKQPSASLSRVYGYVVDAQGQPILDGAGHRIKVAKTTKAKASSPFDTTPTQPGK